MKLLPSLFLALVTSVAQAADKQTIRSHWEAGNTYEQTSQSESTAILGADAAPQTSSVSQTVVIQASKETASGNTLARVKVERIEATIDNQGQPIRYDSSDPAKSPSFIQQVFGAVAGKSFTMVYDKDDKLVETRDLPPTTPIGKTTTLTGEQIVETLRRSQEFALPKGPVAPGERWKLEETLKHSPLPDFLLTGEAKFEEMLTKEGHPLARISYQGTIKAAPGADAAPVTVTFDRDASFSGELLFDLDRKATIQSQFKMQFEASIAGTSIKQTVQNKSALTVTKTPAR